MKIEEVIQTLKSEFCQSDEEILLFITSGVNILLATHTTALIKKGCVIAKLYEDKMSDQLISIMKYLDYKVEEVKNDIMHEV